MSLCPKNTAAEQSGIAHFINFIIPERTFIVKVKRPSARALTGPLHEHNGLEESDGVLAAGVDEWHTDCVLPPSCPLVKGIIRAADAAGSSSRGFYIQHKIRVMPLHHSSAGFSLLISQNRGLIHSL